MGRNGKGSIFVWASGNGRMNGDESNYDELANSLYTICVGASDWNGTVAAYSEAGTNVMVNAPSGNFFFLNGGKWLSMSTITTTDRLGFTGYSTTDCQTQFSGTSASCPLAAGVVALILQANPNLTWRDVQHILIATAEKTDLKHPEWRANGAGLLYNRFYGYIILFPLIFAADLDVFMLQAQFKQH